MTRSTKDVRASRRHFPGAPAVSRLAQALGLAVNSVTPQAHESRVPGFGTRWRFRSKASASHAPATARARHFKQSARLVSNAKGVALIELMMVVGTIMIVSGGVFAIYKVTDAAQRTDREIQNATEVVNNLHNVMAVQGDFGGLDQAFARNNIFPDHLVRGTDVRSSWGDVSMESVALNGVANWGAKLSYNEVPNAACAKFVRGAASGFYEIRINEEVLRTNYAGISPTALINLCSSPMNTVDLIYAKNAGAGIATGPLTPCVVPPPDTHVSACPAGEIGSITRTRGYVCSSSYGTATPLPWSAPVANCVPECVVPTPATETEYASQTAQQNANCPVGQVTNTGAKAFTQTRLESRSRTRTASCPSPTSPISWTTPTAWTPWQPVAGNPGLWGPSALTTCAPACVLPTPNPEVEQETRVVPTTASCPTGQTGAINYEHTERRARQRTATCPAPNSPVSWGNWTTWTAWAPVAGSAGIPREVSNTCATLCVAPPPSNTPMTSPQSCAPGRVTPEGLTTYTASRIRQETWSCPTPTGSPIRNPSTYTPYTPSEAEACVAACVAPAPTETRIPVSRLTYCPAGTFTQDGGTSFRQETVTVTSYSCSTPAGPVVSETTRDILPTIAEMCLPAAPCVITTSTPAADKNRTWSLPNTPLFTCNDSIPNGTYAHGAEAPLTFSGPGRRSGTATYMCYNGKFKDKPEDSPPITCK